MGRRSVKEIQDWEEFLCRERPFVRAKVPRGDNEGRTYTVAKSIADRYEVKRFFASGGCGLLLAGRDSQTETAVLIKTTLRYDCIHHAKYRDLAGFTKQLDGTRKQLEIERRIMVLLRNQGCNGIPNPNDYVYDYNPLLEGPYATEDGKQWQYDDESRLSSEPYLIMEAIAGQTLESLLEDELPRGMAERRALAILQQVTYVLRVLHRIARMGTGRFWNLVYQDLKPANIMLGAHEYTTLLDLGGCQLQINGSVRLPGAFTPGYCPPECGRDVLPLTHAADCYGVGSTLFHLITGRSPTDFLSASLPGTGSQAVAYEKWDWRLLQQRTSRGTYELIRRCLAEKPEERPRDASVLYDDIEQLAGVSMKLRVGERLPDSSLAGPGQTLSGLSLRAPSLYKVTRVVQETPWYGLYEGKKVFRNFNSGTGQLEEAADEECLDVFLKTLMYPRLDDRDFVKARRDHAWFEAKKCMGLSKTNLLPEPLDFLEVPNLQDDFAFPRAGVLSTREPVLVFAKVHGEPLARWLQTQQPSLLRKLRVLANVLAFVEIIHERRFLLTGLGPVALWIDEMDRLRYMATEMMVEAARQDAWRPIFPPERYPAGYSAPEVYAAEPLLDARADLFGWATLAYFLLTGESPVQIARTQGRRYACFQGDHFHRLRQQLAGLSIQDRALVSEWFQVFGLRFTHTWPEGVITSLQQCLEHHPDKRPLSVELLRSTCLRSPPRPLPFAVGIRILPCETVILLPKRDMEVGEEVVVRRGIDSLPIGPNDGYVVVEGPLRDRIIDKCWLLSQSVPFFNVFMRVRGNNEEVFSAGTPVLLLDLAQPEQFRAYAEQCADQEDEPATLLDLNQLPERLELFGRLDDLTVLGASLLGSLRPIVRRWAITLLERQQRKPGLGGNESQLLWQRGLRDARFDLRLAAARDWSLAPVALRSICSRNLLLCSAERTSMTRFGCWAV